MNTIELDKVIIKDRIRTEIEKTKDIDALKESIKLLGLLNPIIINQDDELIAGFRRFTAYRQLKMEVPQTYDKIPYTRITYEDENKSLQAELDENIKRKKLSSYDVATAMKRLKEIYEKEHPETVKGGDRKSKQFKQIQETPQVVNQMPEVGIRKTATTPTGREIKIPDLTKTNREPPKPTHLPAPRFTQKMAEEFNVSETTIKDIIQVAEAIEEGIVSEETKEKFKNREITHNAVLKEVREKPKKPKVKSKGKSKLHIPKQLRYCKDCVKGVGHRCSSCDHRAIICTLYGIFRYYDYEHEACDKFIAP